MEIMISDHARFEAERRGISIDTIMEVAKSPQQEVASIRGRTICQSKLFDTVTDKEMLFRLIVEDAEDIRKVITVYKTSKTDKYWKSEG